jgi:pimeloyl-ACP methyl ester carboxylesterase
MVAAIARPDRVRSLAVWESPMPWLTWWPADTAGGAANEAAADPAGAAEAFMRRMIGDERWDKLPPSTKAARRAEGRTLVAELQSVNQPAFDPADVKVPVVVGTGSASKPHHRGVADALIEMLPAGAELFVFDGADHGCHLSHPAEFARFVELAVSRAPA